MRAAVPGPVVAMEREPAADAETQGPMGKDTSSSVASTYGTASNNPRPRQRLHRYERKAERFLALVGIATILIYYSRVSVESADHPSFRRRGSLAQRA
ncbi:MULTISPECIES: hypothetical protein [Streptomyces albovinaceus subgroup]|uniref:hypothetical protein n=1 Tax=Streptomyces albovinaceus subgroup TaxID=1482558 RepID=UPI00131B48AF|nr:hypothetical protein [Streptomyces mediolani]WSF81089.1 hypothetical protein OG838_35500 [Streptomyces globisporus]